MLGGFENPEITADTTSLPLMYHPNARVGGASQDDINLPLLVILTCQAPSYLNCQGTQHFGRGLVLPRIDSYSRIVVRFDSSSFDLIDSYLLSNLHESSGNHQIDPLPGVARKESRTIITGLSFCVSLRTRFFS